MEVLVNIKLDLVRFNKIKMQLLILFFIVYTVCHLLDPTAIDYLRRHQDSFKVNSMLILVLRIAYSTSDTAM